MPTVITPHETETLNRPEHGSGGGGSGSSGWDGGSHRWDAGGSAPGVSPDTYRLAMWLGVASILMLFAGLSSAYIVRQGASGDWVTIAIPSLLLPNSLVLIASSLTLERSRKLLRKKGLNPSVNFWLSLTGVLGAIFLAGQILIWRQLAAQGIFLSSSSHSSFFYLMTGTHGVHLAGGLIGLAVLIFKARRQVFATESFRTLMDVISIYWHFMDGLWIYLFLLLFFWR
ncbi:MAG: cytochrome c oxidase subunit 3 [Terriglobia bacterium]